MLMERVWNGSRLTCLMSSWFLVSVCIMRYENAAPYLPDAQPRLHTLSYHCCGSVVPVAACTRRLGELYPSARRQPQT